MVEDNKFISLKINTLEIGDQAPPRLMGVLNLSSESFYKGSVVSHSTIVARAEAMISNGAEILDVGGRSTAPKSPIISVDEEKQRVTSGLEILLPQLSGSEILVSLDTQYSAVAEAAVKIFEQNGMDSHFILNDVSGLVTDAHLSEWLADTNYPSIIMASHEKPGDSLGIEQTIKDLRASLEKLERKNYDVSRKTIIDPAIGKWIPEKEPKYDLELIHSLDSFRCLNLPILVAISRKSFIGAILNEKDPSNRFLGTLSATAIAVFKGVHVIRTHDINDETIQIIKVATAIKNQMC